jgi:multidrug resistance efflux pump
VHKDDPRPYEIQLEQANAQFQTASATAALANNQLARSSIRFSAGHVFRPFDISHPSRPKN